jgi:hypothetical protein
MATSNPVTRCLLCHDVIENGDVHLHLRNVHEVAIGEATRADVPVGDYPAPRPLKAERSSKEERVVLAG